MPSQIVDSLGNNPQPPTLGVRLGSSLFLLIFLAFGVVFLVLIGREACRTIQMWHWPTIPCVIESSSITNRSNGYQFQISYNYEYIGKTWHSSSLAMRDQLSSDYAPLQRLAAKYPAGAATQCFVNPDNPAEAILQQGSLWILPFALIPLLFVFIGGGGLYMMWRRASATVTKASPSPIARRQVNASWLFGMFIVIGGVTFYLMSVRTLFDIASARYWTETPCVIKSSRVQSHRDNNRKNSTYSIDILYAYTENSREYRSNRYNFMTGSSSGYNSKEAIVRALPKGTHTVCYVNPNDPSDAVLQRSFTPDMLFGLIPLVFVIFGLIGVIYQFRRSRLRTV